MTSFSGYNRTYTYWIDIGMDAFGGGTIDFTYSAEVTEFEPEIFDGTYPLGVFYNLEDAIDACENYHEGPINWDWRNAPPLPFLTKEVPLRGSFTDIMLGLYGRPYGREYV